MDANIAARDVAVARKLIMLASRPCHTGPAQVTMTLSLRRAGL